MFDAKVGKMGRIPNYFSVKWVYHSALGGIGKVGKYGNISLSIFPVHVSLTYSSGTPLNVIMCIS